MCVAGGVRGGGGGMRGGAGHACHSRYYGIRSMSGQYASYWNAFLLYIEWSSIRLDGHARGIVTTTTQNSSGGSGESVGVWRVYGM